MNMKDITKTINGITYQLDAGTSERAAELFWLALESKPAKTAQDLMSKISLEDYQYLECEGGALHPRVRASITASDRKLLFVTFGEFHWGYRPRLTDDHFDFGLLPKEWQGPFREFWGHHGAAAASVGAYADDDTIGI